jgi:hypothetical protein
VIDRWSVPLRDGSRLRELLAAASKDREPAAIPEVDIPEARGTSSRTAADRATLER